MTTEPTGAATPPTLAWVASRYHVLAAPRTHPPFAPRISLDSPSQPPVSSPHTTGACLAFSGFDDHAHSFAAKQRLALANIYPPAAPPHPQRSVECDALMASAPGKHAKLIPLRSPHAHAATPPLLHCWRSQFTWARPGEITWAVNGPRLAGALAIADDASVARAMRVAFDHFRLVLEPSGALGARSPLGHPRGSRAPCG